jgi:hypothetical protein
MITIYISSKNKFLCGYAGKNWGPVTLIDKRYKGDKGLLEHERTHYKQFLKNPFMGLFYALSERHRLKYEVEAYAVQLKYCTDKVYSASRFGKMLSENYNLNISHEEAEQMILKYYLNKVAK